MTMMPPEDRPEHNPAIHPVYNELNGQVFDGTGDPSINAFVSMYRMMPAVPLSTLTNFEVVLDTGGGGQNPQLDVIGAAAQGVVAIDRTGPRQTLDRVPYVYLFGTVYTTEGFDDGMSWQDRSKVWRNRINEGNSDPIVLDNGHKFVYCQGSLRREGRLAYSAAHDLHDLRTRKQLGKMLKKPLQGTVVVVPTAARTVKPIFVEADVKFTDPIQNAHTRADGDFVSVLDFVKDPKH